MEEAVERSETDEGVSFAGVERAPSSVVLADGCRLAPAGVRLWEAAGQNLEKTMSQKNMGRLAQDMKREVIAIIGRLKDPRLEGGLLTVTRLDVTPDLDVAKVYVSVMGRADGPKPAIEALNRAAGHVRTEVSKKMHIRKAPRFIFVEDDGAAYAAHINELLRSLNVNGEEEAQPADTEQTED